MSVRALFANNRIRHAALLACTLVLACTVLSPILASGYVGDDVRNALIRFEGYQGVPHSRLSEMLVQGNLEWIRNAGRVFPLSGYAGVMFALLKDNVVAYKWILYLLSVLNLALFATVLKRLTLSVGAAVLGVVFVLLAFQHRLFHDPILSFGGLLPVVTLLVLLSVVCLLNNLDGRGKSWLVSSVLLYWAAILTYEICLPFFLVHLAIVGLYPARIGVTAVFRRGWAYLLPPVAAVCLAVFLRLYYGISLSGGATAGAYVPHFDPVTYVWTLTKQTYASLPLSYYSAAKAGAALGVPKAPRFLGNVISYAQQYPVQSAALLAAYGFLTWAALRETAREADWLRVPSRRSLLLLLATLMTVLPGVITSLSPARQAETYPGAGYLPVYLSYFGVALALVVASATLVNRRAPVAAVWTGIIVAAVAFVGVVNYHNNRLVVEVLNRSWAYPHDLLAEALERGLLSDVPDGSTLLVEPDRFWDEPLFYLNHSGKRVRAVLSADEVKREDLSSRLHAVAENGNGPVYRLGEGGDVYYLSYGATARGNGDALLSRVVELSVESGRVSQLKLSPVVAFESRGEGDGHGVVVTGAEQHEGTRYVTSRTRGFRRDDLRVLSRGQTWTLSSASSETSPLVSVTRR